MITDVVCEKIIKKKREAWENIVTAALVITAVIIVAAMVLLMLSNPALGAFSLAAVFGVIYGLVKLIGRLNIEYEYCFVNGELTIDKIINKSSRKPMIVLDVKNIEKIGWYDEMPVFTNYRRIDCAESREPEKGIYISFKDGGGSPILLVMSNDDKVLTSMKRYIRPMVFREGFKNYDPSASLSGNEAVTAAVGSAVTGGRGVPAE